jgi:hypothetical protein
MNDDEATETKMLFWQPEAADAPLWPIGNSPQATGGAA